ncbi:hypothetical protein GCM10028820_31500 [Tessaracoccus terricola]
MSSPKPQGHPDVRWAIDEVVKAMDGLRPLGPILYADPEATVGELKRMAPTFPSQDVLSFLKNQDPFFTKLMLEDLIPWADTEWAFAQIGDLLGRIHHEDLERVAPALMIRYLQSSGEDERAFSTMAQLARSLGLKSASQEIHQLALASDSEALRRDAAEGDL